MGEGRGRLERRWGREECDGIENEKGIKVKEGVVRTTEDIVSGVGK